MKVDLKRIETIARQALKKLKSQYELPNFGVLSGASLSNTMWEIVSGNRAVIRDIDIFIHSFNKETFKEFRNFKANFDADGYILNRSQEFFITETTRENYINYINYYSHSNDPMNVIGSFDLNCVQVCYDIKSDKFYYTDGFIDFLRTGKIKVISLKTPLKTVVRLSQKQIDLNVTVDEIEYLMLGTIIRYPSKDVFTNPLPASYCAKMIGKNSQIIEKYFTYTLISDLTYITPKECPIIPHLNSECILSYFRDIHTYIQHLTNDQITEIQRIYYILWKLNLQTIHIFLYKLDDLIRISEFCDRFVLVSDKLKENTFSENFRILTQFLGKFEYEIAGCILENKTINKNIILDEDTIDVLIASIRWHMRKSRYQPLSLQLTLDIIDSN